MLLSSKLSRRKLLHTAIMGGLCLAATRAGSARQAPSVSSSVPFKGSLKQSVTRLTLGRLPLDELSRVVKRIGISAIDHARPEHWPTLRAHGVDCSLCSGAAMGLEKGFGVVQHHDELVARYMEHIDLVAAAGYRSLECFAGNRNGMSPEEGMENAVAGLKRLLAHAEKRGVTLVMELLNSKVDHPDYLCDRTEWGVELCKRLGSPNFGLLYDIYHMQIMEGDIIATIRKYHQYFAHYHAAGVPGRHEIGGDQELNYPAICRAIVATGFKGYFAHEFVPTLANPVDSLRDALFLCDV